MFLFRYFSTLWYSGTTWWLEFEASSNFTFLSELRLQVDSSKQLLQRCNPKIHPLGRTTPGSATYQFSFGPVPFIAAASEDAARHSVLKPIRVGRRPTLSPHETLCRTCNCWLKRQTLAIHQHSGTRTASVCVEFVRVCVHDVVRPR